MVKCEKGECMMAGTFFELVAETSCLVAGVYKEATKIAGEKFAKVVMDSMFSVVTDKDVQDSVTEKKHMTINRNSIMEALKNLED